jgi:PhzF family phenazine biosynthesis protein
LTAKRNGAWIVLDFPALPATPAETPDFLAGALGAEPVACCTSEFDFLVELADETAVRSLSPDHAALKAIDARGIIVTARGSGEFDFVSRFFAPRHRIDEDPVTGSAHCVLGPYWRARLGKDSMTAYQASERGGVVRVTCAGERVHLAGKAVTVMEGTLL